MSKNTNELKTGLPGRFGIDLSTLGSQLCSAKSLSQCRLRDLGLPCLATSYLSPSARCASVNGLAGCYVSSIGLAGCYVSSIGFSTLEARRVQKHKRTQDPCVALARSQT